MAGMNEFVDLYADEHGECSPLETELILNGEFSEKMRIQEQTLLSPVPMRCGPSSDAIARTPRRISGPDKWRNEWCPVCRKGRRRRF